MAEHSLETKGFQCIKCDKKYTRNEYLVIHYKKHHGGKNAKTKPATAKVILNSDETEFFSSDLSLESNEDDSRSTTTDEKPHSSASNPPDGSTIGRSRKRRAEEDEVANFEYVWNGFGYDNDDQMLDHNNNNNLPAMTEMQSWCATLAITLEKMPPEYQVKMKMEITFIVGKAELDILRPNDDDSAEPADSDDTTSEETGAENPIESEIE